MSVKVIPLNEYIFVLSTCELEVNKSNYREQLLRLRCPKGMYNPFICLVCKLFILRKTPHRLDLNENRERTEGEVVCVMDSNNLQTMFVDCT
jgi:hypothetical protein